MKKKIFIVAAAVLALTALWVLSPVATGQNYLNENHKASLCDVFAGEVDADEAAFYKSIGAEAATAAAVDIIGVQKSGDEFYVYGNEWDGTYVNFKGEAYNNGGGCGVFMVRLRCNGDDVEIVESYGGVSTMETLEAMPLRYSLKAQLFSGEFGYGILEQEVHNKIEDKLNVPVNEEYVFSAEDGVIEVFTWIGDHAEYKYKIKL